MAFRRSPFEQDQILLTGDGLFVDGRENTDHDDGFLRIDGTLVFDPKAIGGEEKRLLTAHPDRFNLVGKSGLCQVGIDLLKMGAPDLERDTVAVPAQIVGCMGLVHGRILSVIQDRSNHGGLTLGRGLITPRTALSASEIRDAITGNHLLLPEGADVDEDGVITLPLDALHYILALENLESEEQILRFLRLGKHGLNTIRDVHPGPRPESIPPNGFYLGAVNISIGPYDAVIELEQSVNGLIDSNLRHLSALVLDGVRTTGLNVPRQVELLNRGSAEIHTDRIKVRLRLYHSSERTRSAASRLITQETLRRGVTFHDVTGLLLGDQAFLDLFEQVDGTREEKPAALLLSRGRSEEVGWRPTPTLQAAHLMARVDALMSGGIHFNGGVGGNIVREVANSLAFVGGAQEAGSMLVTRGFPDVHTMVALFRAGVGSFTARNLGWGPLDGSAVAHDPYFDETTYNGFRELAAKGAILHMVFPEIPGVPAHVRQFYKGLWVRPKDKERLDKVRCSIAMYGSAVDAVDPILAPQIDLFMTRMSHLFGEDLAIIHGKGPGVMLAADQAAEKQRIFRIGVGIHVEKLGQAANFKPDGMVDFLDNHRLTRQKYMDDLATFKIFNIGGAGTLEEAAITLCSQKLGKNIPTPIIFVDPIGLGRNGAALFADLKVQIECLAAKHCVDQDGAQQAIQLLAAHNPGFMHVVSSYQEAGDIIQSFTNDPIAYYQRIQLPYLSLHMAYQQGVKNLAEMGFDPPRFITSDVVYSPRTRERLAA